MKIKNGLGLMVIVMGCAGHDLDVGNDTASQDGVQTVLGAGGSAGTGDAGGAPGDPGEPLPTFPAQVQVSGLHRRVFLAALPVQLRSLRRAPGCEDDVRAHPFG
jgi:hypothetical protein